MKKYSTREKEKKVFAIVMLIILTIALVVVIIEGCGLLAGPDWKPAAEYPFANQKITWTYAKNK